MRSQLPQHIKDALDQIDRAFLSTVGQLDSSMLKDITQHIKSLRRRRTKRLLLRIALEMFLGFILVAIVLERNVQHAFEELVTSLLPQGPYRAQLSLLLIFVVLLLAWLLKSKLIDPRVHHFLRHVKKRHLERDVVEAWHTQAELAASYHVLEWLLKYRDRARPDEPKMVGS